MPRSLLIDANLLVLLVVGLTDPMEIGKHKRARAYTDEDFSLLLTQLDDYQELWVTSQAVAECSNLLRQTNPVLSERLMHTLEGLIERVKESNMSSRVVFSENCVHKLGITDAGIAKKSKRVTTLLTADLDLYLEVSNSKGNAVNFNHVRMGAWQTDA